MKTKRIIKIIIVTIILSSCAPMYIPNKVNAPLLSNKKELQASVNAGICGFDPQFAYALTDKVGLMLNGSFNNTKDDCHKFVELGAGYYKSLDKTTRFEVFTGFGYGKYESNSDFIILGSDVNYSSKVDAYRFFIQPDIGITNKIIDASFTPRFVIFSATNKDISYNRTFLEPTLTFSAGYQYVKFIMQIGASFPLSSSAIDYEPLILSVGIHARLFRNYDNSKTVY